MSYSVNESPPPTDYVTAVRPGLGIGRSLVLCVVFYAVLIAGFLLAGMILGNFSPSEHRPPMNYFSWLLIPQIVAWIITIKLGLQWLGISFREGSRLTPFPARIVPALLVASFGATVLLVEVVFWIPMPELLREATLRQHAATDKLAVVLPVVIVAPLAEEIFFRGLVLRGYLERYSTTKVIWASAILFAVFHLNPWQAALALPLGVWYAWMVLRTGSVIPSIISHAMVNFSMNFLLAPLAGMLGHTSEEIAVWRHLPPSMLLVGAAATLAGGIILHRQLAANSPSQPAQTVADDARETDPSTLD